MDGLANRGAKASVMVNAIIAERSPQTVRAVADRGHEVLSHSYAMDVIPGLLSDEEERRNIARCSKLLAEASGRRQNSSPKPAIAGMATCSTSIFRDSSAMATTRLSPSRCRTTSTICLR
jgi:peptidoglycan/xylan/chitin deacetylase (PgdA/CDA1 family)